MTNVSEWVLATEESGYTRHFTDEALPIRIGSRDGDNIKLAGVAGSVQIGQLDGVFFVQPGRQTENLRVNGELLRGSKRVEDGDVVALDTARLKCRLTGRRLTVAIEAQVTAGDTAPPDLDQVARQGADEIAIKPVAFHPNAGANARPALHRPTPASIAVAGAFFVLAVLGWFAFTAKSVEFIFDPAVDEMSLPGTTFKLQIGERYLLRSGRHELTANLAGYYPLETTIDVGRLPDQTIELKLTKLPGLITLVTEPEVRADVTVDGELIGATPLADTEIAPGKHQLQFMAERYLSEVRELEVEGGRERQTVSVSLTPSWAPVSIVSEPPGAEVLVDGRSFGHTPAQLELTAGERELQVTLRGHNAWRSRIMVVANTPQELPPIVLEPADGRVALTSLPADAAVSVDGEFRGRTPVDLRLHPDQRHMITIAKPGYATATRDLTVAADSRRELEIELEQLIGDVDVQSEPSGAEIWIDDRLVGTTPSRVSLLAVNHSIEIRAEGYATQNERITPQPGFPQALMFELEALDESTGGGYPLAVTTSLGQTLRLIPAGRFTMGSSRQERFRRSNEVLRQVEISEAFYLGVREVTNAEFREYMEDHDSGTFGDMSLDGDDQPVVNLRWEDAAQFLNWLSIKDELQPVYTQTLGAWAPVRPLRDGYRLPTEAEWAWAARAAGREGPLVYSWGDAPSPPDRFENLADLSAQEILPRTLVTYSDGFPVAAPVGSFAPNPVGILDLGGNVSEWVQDFYGIDMLPSEEVQVDPLGPVNGAVHVYRGPSWRSATTTDLRLAYRGNAADGREDLGFRIARNLH